MCEPATLTMPLPPMYTSPPLPETCGAMLVRARADPARPGVRGCPHHAHIQACTKTKTPQLTDTQANRRAHKHARASAQQYACARTCTKAYARAQTNAHGSRTHTSAHTPSPHLARYHTPMRAARTHNRRDVVDVRARHAHGAAAAGLYEDQPAVPHLRVARPGVGRRTTQAHRTRMYRPGKQRAVKRTRTPPQKRAHTRARARAHTRSRTHASA